MACHALGRCRICARKHKIALFGSEEDQHYLIEKANLKLIILNTVCIVCMAKIERYVDKIDPELMFSNYKKEQDIHEGTTDVNQVGIISPACIIPDDKATEREEGRKMEAEKCYGTATAATDVETFRTADPQAEKNCQGNFAADDKNKNKLDTSLLGSCRDAKVTRPKFTEYSNISDKNKNRIETEALARLISTLGVRVRKRPRNYFDDESNQGDLRGPKTAALSPPENDNKDRRNASTSSSACAIESSKNVKTNRDDSSSPIAKKVGGRFLSCDFCKKTFTHAGDLNKHRRKHTGEKPYECNQCQRKFAHASNLARHHRVHSGERPFVCPKCDRGFTRQDKLAIHVAGGRCQNNNNNSNLNAPKPSVAVI